MTAKLWDTAIGKLVGSFAIRIVLARRIQSGRLRILTASADKSAKLWDRASGKPMAPFDHEMRVTTRVQSGRRSDPDSK